MTKPMIVMAAAIVTVAAANANEERPAFPKLSVEYQIRLPEHWIEQATPEKKWMRGEDRVHLSLDHVSKNVIFDRWLGGTWYAVTYLSDSSGIDQTNLNISQLITLKEAPISRRTVTNAIETAAANKAAAEELAAKKAEWQRARAEKVAAIRAAAAARKEAEERAAAEQEAAETN